MKPETFDALTKMLATPQSRRRALQNILGILVGGSSAALLSEHTWRLARLARKMTHLEPLIDIGLLIHPEQR